MRLAVKGLTAFLFFSTLACGDDVRLFQEKRILMDTLVSITIYAVEEPKDWHSHIREAFEVMENIERLTTSYNDSSEVGLVNSLAGIGNVPVSDDVLKIIDLARRVSELSHGAFDITIWPLLRLWDFKAEKPVIPDSAQIIENLDHIGYGKVQTNAKTVFLSETGMGIDLGGIAKGYAVDRGVEVLRRHGYDDFMVEAGGDLRAVAGELTRGRRKIWVRHPREKETFFAAIELDDGAVATSGDYERFFEISGKRYHHIVDPATGYPGRASVSVTIIAKETAYADALATAVFVLGPERGMELLERTPEVEGLIIYLQDTDIVPSLTFRASEGIKDRIKLVN